MKPHKYNKVAYHIYDKLEKKYKKMELDKIRDILLELGSLSEHAAKETTTVNLPRHLLRLIVDYVIEHAVTCEHKWNNEDDSCDKCGIEKSDLYEYQIAQGIIKTNMEDVIKLRREINDEN